MDAPRDIDELFKLMPGLAQPGGLHGHSPEPAYNPVAPMTPEEALRLVMWSSPGADPATEAAAPTVSIPPKGLTGL